MCKHVNTEGLHAFKSEHAIARGCCSLWPLQKSGWGGVSDSNVSGSLVDQSDPRQSWTGAKRMVELTGPRSGDVWTGDCNVSRSPSGGGGDVVLGGLILFSSCLGPMAITTCWR